MVEEDVYGRERRQCGRRVESYWEISREICGRDRCARDTLNSCNTGESPDNY